MDCVLPEIFDYKVQVFPPCQCNEFKIYAVYYALLMFNKLCILRYNF